MVHLLGRKTLRRVLIFAMTLSLVGVGLVPLSACAFLFSKMTECATPKTQSQCDRMNMDESGTPSVTAPDRSCCFNSNEPISQSRYKASDPSLSATYAQASDQMGDPPRAQHSRSIHRTQEFSPPRLQPLLCTFLI